MVPSKTSLVFPEIDQPRALAGGGAGGGGAGICQEGLRAWVQESEDFKGWGRKKR